VKALFKPQWYPRDVIIRGPVYHGKDRHNAEVVAFHLSSLLALRRVPLAVIRKRMLKLNEIKSPIQTRIELCIQDCNVIERLYAV